MVTKVKGRSYFFLSSVFGCVFTRHLLQIVLDGNLVMIIYTCFCIASYAFYVYIFIGGLSEHI